MRTLRLLFMLTIACVGVGCGSRTEKEAAAKLLRDRVNSTAALAIELCSRYEFVEANRVLDEVRQQVEQSRSISASTYEDLRSQIQIACTRVAAKEDEHRAKVRDGWSSFEGKFISPQEKTEIVQARERAAQKKQEEDKKRDDALRSSYDTAKDQVLSAIKEVAAQDPDVVRARNEADVVKAEQEYAAEQSDALKQQQACRDLSKRMGVEYDKFKNIYSFYTARGKRDGQASRLVASGAYNYGEHPRTVTLEFGGPAESAARPRPTAPGPVTARFLWGSRRETVQSHVTIAVGRMEIEQLSMTLTWEQAEALSAAAGLEAAVEYGGTYLPMPFDPAELRAFLKECVQFFEECGGRVVDDTDELDDHSADQQPTTQSMSRREEIASLRKSLDSDIALVRKWFSPCPRCAGKGCPRTYSCACRTTYYKTFEIGSSTERSRTEFVKNSDGKFAVTVTYECAGLGYFRGKLDDFQRVAERMNAGIETLRRWGLGRIADDYRGKLATLDRLARRLPSEEVKAMVSVPSSAKCR